MRRKERHPRRRFKEPGRLRRRVLWASLILAVVVLMLLARSGYWLWTRGAAADRLQSGAISDARHYLGRAAWCAPNDGRIDLMLAFCYRQQRQPDLWRQALEAAEKKGVARADIEREMRLYRIQSGNWPEETESQLGTLAGEGLTSYDVPTAFVAGCLVDGRYELAQQILDVWNSDAPNDPHVAHMRGCYWYSLGDVRQAREQFELAISLEGGHEGARISLAKLFEENNQLQQAHQQYVALASTSHDAESGVIGTARVLRKMGHLSRAQAALEPFARTTGTAKRAAQEMGCIVMERGDLAHAEQWFERAGIQDTRDPELLMSALRLRGLQGRASEAERLYQRLAALGDRVTRLRDLRIKLALDPGDATTAAEINRLYEGLDGEMSLFEVLPRDFASEDDNVSLGRRLFVLHCSACHGVEGDGNGLAARHLFPRARNLRAEPSRLVSTRNGAPTLDDTVIMLRRGISGSSMRAYTDLDDNELRSLADEVHRIRREGLPEHFVRMLELQGEEITDDDIDEVEEAVSLLTTPGDAVVVPQMGEAEPAAIVRGKDAYRELGCTSCHGEDGAGAEDQRCYDERGFPVRPRDLVGEPFKGGHEAASVYYRIVAGMPGSPHPSCADVPQQSVIDLVQYCISLSREPKTFLSDHQRAALAAVSAYRVFLSTAPACAAPTRGAMDLPGE